MDSQTQSEMQPGVDVTDLLIPVTIDGSQSKLNTLKIRALLAIPISVVSILIAIGALIRFGWLMGPVVALLVLLVFWVLIRFLLMNENLYSKEYSRIRKNSNRMQTNAYWRIYSVGEQSPHVVRFQNGLSGIFVRMDKGVIIGKNEQDEYQHFESIANALGRAAALDLDVMRIDYMSQIGNDPRISSKLKKVSQYQNPDLRDVMTRMYVHLDHEMQESYSTFDVILFTSAGDEGVLASNVEEVMAHMLEANYERYYSLPPREIRQLVLTLFNLEEFSVGEANFEAFSSTSSSIKPISLRDVDGTLTVFAPTVAERKTQAANKAKKDAALAKEREHRRQEEKRSKKLQKDISKGRVDPSTLPEEEQLDEDMFQ